MRKLYNIKKVGMAAMALAVMGICFGASTADAMLSGKLYELYAKNFNFLGLGTTTFTDANGDVITTGKLSIYVHQSFDGFPPNRPAGSIVAPHRVQLDDGSRFLPVGVAMKGGDWVLEAFVLNSFGGLIPELPGIWWPETPYRFKFYCENAIGYSIGFIEVKGNDFTEVGDFYALDGTFLARYTCVAKRDNLHNTLLQLQSDGWVEFEGINE